MATSDRADRQLMRQRGAGLRSVNNADFGLEFGPQDSRENRQLMRQRGAGTRDIGNIDFGFSFPTPNQSRKSSTTRRETRASIAPNSRTPVPTQEKLPDSVKLIRNESVGVDVAPPSRQRLSTTPQPSLQAEQPNSGKRRRLERPIRNLISSNIASTPLTSDFASRTQNTSTASIVNGDDNLEVTRLNTPGRSESPLFFRDSENKGTGSNKRQRRNVRVSWMPSPDSDAQTYHMAKDQISESIEFPESTPMATTVEEVDGFQLTRPYHSSLPPTNLVRSSSVGTVNLSQNPANPNEKPKKKRKKRKSVILVPKKRRSSGSIRKSLSEVDANIASSEPGNDASPKSQQEPSMIEAESEGSEAESSCERPTPLWKKLVKGKARNRSRSRVSTSPVLHDRGNEEEEDDDDETYIEEENSPEPMTPAPKKSAGSRELHKAASRKNKRKILPKSAVNGFPISIHRMINTHALPTIVEQDEGTDVSDSNDGPSQPAITSRVQPNAVDVLAQICRETIQSAVAKMESSTSGLTSRAEIKNKRKAVEVFGENLDQRLFDMSQAVEHRMTLEARLRKSKRQKAELQARWLEIRQQRDELALKADGIRRQNWDNEEDSKQRWQISELAHKIGLDLEREDSEEEDLEFMLKKVVSAVCRTEGQGGILEKVRSFNSHLEKVATFLERR